MATRARPKASPDPVRLKRLRRLAALTPQQRVERLATLTSQLFEIRAAGRSAREGM